MPIRPSIIFAVIWLGWLVSWIVAGFWTNRTEKRAATWDVWAYRVLVSAGALLLFDTTRRVCMSRACGTSALPALTCWPA